MTYNHRGIAYYEKGQYVQAISDYTKAVELNPKGDMAYFNRAIAYYSMGEYGRSWEDIKKAENLGKRIPAEFIDKLRKASERQN